MRQCLIDVFTHCYYTQHYDTTLHLFKLVNVYQLLDLSTQYVKYDEGLIHHASLCLVFPKVKLHVLLKSCVGETLVFGFLITLFNYYESKSDKSRRVHY